MSISIVYIIISALLDIVANLLLVCSNGFKKPLYGVGAVLLVFAAFYLLSLAIVEIPLAIAYTLWGCIGIVGTTLGGWYFFAQKLNIIGWIGIAFVIVAIALLNHD